MASNKKSWAYSAAGQIILTFSICAILCFIFFLIFKIDVPNYTITVPDDWTYVADDAHGHYVKTKTVETTVTKITAGTYRRNRHYHPCLVYVMKDDLPYFEELSEVTYKTNQIENYGVNIQDNLKVGDKVKITTTARLDVSGDNKPGTACYSGFDIQVVKE